MTIHYIAFLRDEGDDIVSVEHYPTRAEALAARNPVEPPPPPPPPGGNIDQWLPPGFVPKVTLPRGHVGAFPNAEVIKITGPIVGQTLSNVVVDVLPGFVGSAALRKCALDHVTVLVNGNASVGNVVKDCKGHHVAILDVDLGDAGKAGDGETIDLEDFVVTFVDRVHGATDKHVDGVQMFKTSTGNRLVRGFFDWNDSGTRANTTAAIFTHDGADLFARDITIVNPGGTFEIIQLSGTGRHDVARVHVWGMQKLNPKHGKMLPRAIVEGHRFEVLHNDVPGAADWLVG